MDYGLYLSRRIFASVTIFFFTDRCCCWMKILSSCEHRLFLVLLDCMPWRPFVCAVLCMCEQVLSQTCPHSAKNIPRTILLFYGVRIRYMDNSFARVLYFVCVCVVPVYRATCATVCKFIIIIIIIWYFGVKIVTSALPCAAMRQIYHTHLVWFRVFVRMAFSPGVHVTK